jgi:hypothetical protein
MKLFGKIVICDGLDVYMFNRWIGLHYYWQSIPLFGIINSHRKCNTLHQYGVVFFGLWLYLRIDE